jgi:hypothetical protein
LQLVKYGVRSSLFGLHVHMQLYSLNVTPQLPPPPAFGLIYVGAIGRPRKTTSFCDPLLNCVKTHGESDEYVDVDRWIKWSCKLYLEGKVELSHSYKNQMIKNALLFSRMD